MSLLEPNYPTIAGSGCTNTAEDKKKYLKLTNEDYTGSLKKSN